MDLRRRYSIILLDRYPNKDEAVARQLAQVFGRDENWGLEVVEASPATLLFDLSATQAEFILKSLQPVEQAGSRFEILEGVHGLHTKWSWDEPPCVLGRPVT